MKHIVAVCAAVSLSGCIMGGGTVGPTELPKGFDLGMWSARPVGDVQACIAQLGPVGARFTAHQAPRNDGGYQTVVASRSGHVDEQAPGMIDEAPAVFRCL